MFKLIKYFGNRSAGRLTCRKANLKQLTEKEILVTHLEHFFSEFRHKRTCSAIGRGHSIAATRIVIVIVHLALGIHVDIFLVKKKKIYKTKQQRPS
jgi:hypothetical protein